LFRGREWIAAVVQRRLAGYTRQIRTRFWRPLNSPTQLVTRGQPRSAANHPLPRNLPLRRKLARESRKPLRGLIKFAKEPFNRL
jgi:hypothetical protein